MQPYNIMVALGKKEISNNSYFYKIAIYIYTCEEFLTYLQQKSHHVHHFFHIYKNYFLKLVLLL